MKNQKLLLVDDDTELCELLTTYITNEGFKIDAVNDGETALDIINNNYYDLIILDVMLPKISGFDLLKQIRKSKQTPILMLTAKGDDIDRIIGLELGADDYLPKPCNSRELVARIKAILRRSNNNVINNNEQATTIVLGSIKLDQKARKITKNNKLIQLTSAEFNIISVLMKNAGNIITKEELSQQALSRKLLSYDRHIDMHISHIRKKIGAHPDGNEIIQTVRSAGYIYTINNTST